MKKITFKEVVELFINTTIYEIKNETETPRFNIIFKEDAYKLFKYVMDNPFVKKNHYTPNIEQEDIELLKILNNQDYPTIYVNNHIKFFYLLKEITNNLIILYNYFGEEKHERELLIQLLRRIWLRMNINDFNNVELFLENQLNFLKLNKFDCYQKEKYFTNFLDYKITLKTSINRTFDETTRCMSFSIHDNDNCHLLPNIYYDIKDDTCYIYAIQTDSFSKKIDYINKLIYKLYKGNSQPNMVLSLKLFLELLKENNISKIKVPILQVLSYPYHELLSQKTKSNFLEKWNDERLKWYFKYLNKTELKYKLEQFEREKTWYSHVVGKEDMISKLKTENLINLVYRITKEDDSLTLLTDIDICDTLDIKIKKN